MCFVCIEFLDFALLLSLFSGKAFSPESFFAIVILPCVNLTVRLLVALSLRNVLTPHVNINSVVHIIRCHLEMASFYHWSFCIIVKLTIDCSKSIRLDKSIVVSLSDWIYFLHYYLSTGYPHCLPSQESEHDLSE